MVYLDPRREAARGLFEFLEKHLASDEVLSDRRCVQQILEKAASGQAKVMRKRFDAEACFRTRLLFPRIDDVVAAWCARRNLKTDPFKVFRYGGTERGPTQHETAIGPGMAMIGRAFDRLVEKVPEISDCRKQAGAEPNRAIAPAFRLQPPLPFGVAGEVTYGASRRDIDRGIYRAALYAASGGDPARGWRYDGALFLAYGKERTRDLLGVDLWERWPDVQERIWEAGRVWVILL